MTLHHLSRKAIRRERVIAGAWFLAAYELAS